jgi:hypothetical protein
MEEVCELENSKPALQRVKANKGSPGVDEMTVAELELPEYRKQHGPEIGEQLRNGTYLIRAFLEAGVMEDGLVSAVDDPKSSMVRGGKAPLYLWPVPWSSHGAPLSTRPLPSYTRACRRQPTYP